MLLCLSPRTLDAAPVTAVENPVTLPSTEEARYRIYWNGLRLGKLWFYWREEGGRYEAQISIKTSGMARVFSKQDRGASISGRYIRRMGMESYIPEKYEYFAKRKKKNRDVDILYQPDGTIKEVSVNPPDDPRHRPPVSDTARNAAYDPLTALRAIQHYLHTRSQGGRDSSQHFTVYDGRRLTRIVAIPAEGGSSCGEGCFIAQGTRELLEGYTEEEKQEFAEEKEPAVTIEASPATSRFPLRIYTDSPYGRISAERY